MHLKSVHSYKKCFPARSFVIAIQFLNTFQIFIIVISQVRDKNRLQAASNFRLVKEFFFQIYSRNF